MEREGRELEARMARLRPLAGPAAFDAGFADRVMARIARQPTLADGLQRVFLRLAPLAAAAVLILATANFLGSRTSGQPFLDRVLSLQPATLGAALAFDVSLATEVR